MLLVGLGEFVRADQIGLATHVGAVLVTGIGEQATLVAGLRLTPGGHDLDGLSEGVRDRTTAALGVEDAFLARSLIPVGELLPVDDVLLTGGVGHDLVAFVDRIGRFLGTVGQLGHDLLTGHTGAGLDLSLLFENRGGRECSEDIIGFAVDLFETHDFSVS